MSSTCNLQAPAALQKPKQIANFCRMCGGKLDMRIPDGDDHWRHCCADCGYIDFFNPKLVQPQTRP